MPLRVHKIKKLMRFHREKNLLYLITSLCSFDKGPEPDRHTVQLKTKNNEKKVQLDIRETLLMPGAFEQSHSKTLGETEVKVKNEE